LPLFSLGSKFGMTHVFVAIMENIINLILIIKRTLSLFIYNLVSPLMKSVKN